MKQPPVIEVHATLTLSLLGTTITVESFDTAIKQLQRQALTVGKPQKLLVQSEPPSTYLIGNSVEEASFTTPDAELTATGWTLVVDGTPKLSLKTQAPLLARAKALATHHGAEQITVASLQGTEQISLTAPPTETAQEAPTPHVSAHQAMPQHTANPEAREPQKQEHQESETPPALDSTPQIPQVEHPQAPAIPDSATEIPPDTDTEAEAEAEAEAMTEVYTPPTPARAEVSFAQEVMGTPTEADADAEESWHFINQEPDKTSSKPTRRALLIGIGTVALLGAGSFAFSKLGNPTPSNTAVPAPTEVPAVTPLMPGIEGTPLRQFPLAYSDLAVSTDGTFTAVQISETEILIEPTLASPDSPSAEGATITFEGNLVPPILPLSTTAGPGFIFRVAKDNPSIGSPTTLFVWTPTGKTVKHQLNVGATLSTRNGQPWIGSTVTPTGPRIVQSIGPTKLTSYTAPSQGPAFLALVSKERALWASLNADQSAALILADAKGKNAKTTKLERPTKTSVVAKWVIATENHALLVWKESGGKLTAAIHATNTGKISASTPFELSAETSLERLSVVSFTDGINCILGDLWINLKTGQFGAPEDRNLTGVKAQSRHGAVQLTSTSTSIFITNDGTTLPAPTQGTVLAVTEQAMILEESGLASVYKKTNTTK